MLLVQEDDGAIVTFDDKQQPALRGRRKQLVHAYRYHESILPWYNQCMGQEIAKALVQKQLMLQQLNILKHRSLQEF